MSDFKWKILHDPRDNFYIQPAPLTVTTTGNGPSPFAAWSTVDYPCKVFFYIEADGKIRPGEGAELDNPSWEGWSHAEKYMPGLRLGYELQKALGGLIEAAKKLPMTPELQMSLVGAMKALREFPVIMKEKAK